MTLSESSGFPLSGGLLIWRTEPLPKLTKRNVDLAAPAAKDTIHWDDDMPGFGLRVKPTGVKSYIVQYRQDGRSRRMTIGRHGALTAEEVRKIAHQTLGFVSQGKDPQKTGKSVGKHQQ